MLTLDNIAIILYVLPIYQLLFYSIQLISFKRSNPSRKYLGLLLLSMTSFLIINTLYQQGSSGLILGFYYFFIPLLIIQPPLFYLYIFALAREGEYVKRFDKLILFIPGLFILISNLFIFGIRSTQKLELFLVDDRSFLNILNGASDLPLLMLWFNLVLLLAVVLIFAVFKVNALLKTEKAAIKQQHAHIALLQFKWVYIISFSLLIFIIAGALQILFIGKVGLTISIFFNVIMLISGGLAGYFGMKQDNLFTEVSGVGTRPVSFTDKNNNTELPGKLPDKMKKIFHDKESEEIIQKIEMLMEREKPYLNKRFGIADLCRQIDVRQNKVTFVINEVMGKNFYGLINEYRIREAMRVMETDNQNLTIDAIADLVGFHSRSSFYPCFMKYSGLTPKEFVLKVKRIRMKDAETVRR